MECAPLPEAEYNVLMYANMLPENKEVFDKTSNIMFIDLCQPSRNRAVNKIIAGNRNNCSCTETFCSKELCENNNLASPSH